MCAYICNKCNIKFRKKLSLDNHYLCHTKLPNKYETKIKYFVNYNAYTETNINKKTKIYYYNNKHYLKIYTLIKKFKNVEFINLYNTNPNDIDIDETCYILILLNKDHCNEIETIKKFLMKFKYENRYLYLNKNGYHANLYKMIIQLEMYIYKIFSQLILPNGIWIPGHHRLNDVYCQNVFKNFTIENKPYLASKTICISPSSTSRNSATKIALMKYFIEKYPTIDIYEQHKYYYKDESINKNLIKLNESRQNINIQSLCRFKNNIFENYKYVIIIENDMHFGCLTEKLIDSLGCLSLPIYFGSPNVKELMPKLFKNGIIDGFKTTLDELTTYLNNMSEDEYNMRINTIKTNRIYYYKKHSFDKISDFMINYMCNIQNV